jgi:hypothetical protein
VPRDRVPTELAQAHDLMLEAVSSWAAVASSADYQPHDAIAYEALMSVTGKCLDHAYLVQDAARERLHAARDTKSQPNADDEDTGRRRSERDTLSSIVHYTQRYASSLGRYLSFLESPAMLASHRRCLFMTGSAGQGKTHLLCDAADQAISEGAPALVLLGERFGGRVDPWGQVAAQLGLGHVGSEVLIGAMEAAAEASNNRFLFLIDAVNESQDAALWRAELRVMSTQLSGTGWIGFGVSCRSSYIDIVVPPHGLGDLFATVDHPGFANRETEALSNFFDHFKLEQPRVPFLLPELSNPLFLKLHCEGLAALGMTAPPAGHQHSARSLSGSFNLARSGFTKSSISTQPTGSSSGQHWHWPTLSQWLAAITSRMRRRSVSRTHSPRRTRSGRTHCLGSCSAKESCVGTRCTSVIAAGLRRRSASRTSASRITW